MLAQSKGAKRKGTLHCVDAVHRCLALLAYCYLYWGRSRNSLRSDTRLLFPFLAVLLSASASAKGSNTEENATKPLAF